MKQFIKVALATILVMGTINMHEVIAENTEATSMEVTETESEVTNETSQETKPLSEVVGAGNTVVISIPEYDETTGWGAQRTAPETKTIYVTANFQDNTSAGKELTIILPEGMVYSQIVVAEGKYSTAGVDTSLLSSLSAIDPIAVATESITLPTRETRTGSTFGTLNYAFSAGTQSVTIAVKVTPDVKKIMSSHTLSNPIKVITSMNGTTLEEVSQQVNVSCTDRKVTFWRARAGTAETQANTADETFLARTDEVSLEFLYTYVKNFKAYYYYPEGAKFEGSTFTTEGVIHDDENNRLIFDLGEKYINGFKGDIIYSFPEGTEPGIYSAQPMYFEYETYNGEKKEVMTSYSYSVVVKDVIISKLSIEPVSYQGDLTIPNFIFEGPKFILSNSGAVSAKNTVVHYTVDSILEPRVIIFPYSNGIGNFTRLEYKVTGSDEWIVADQSVLDTIKKESKIASITVDDLSLDDGTWITEIRGWIGDIPAGYRSTGAHVVSPGVFGILHSEEDIFSSVKMSTYRDDMPEETRNTSTGILRGYTEASGQRAASNSNGYFTNSNGARTTSIVAGEDFNIHLNLGIHTYPYGDQTFLQSPVIYLVEPKGINININSLILTNSVDGEKVNIESIERYTANASGENVYKIIVDSNFVLGVRWDEIKRTFIEQLISVKVSASTSMKLSGDYSLKDMVAFGSQENIVAISSYAHTLFDDSVKNVDQDGSTKLLLNLSTTAPKLFIQENKNVLVETFLSLAGEDPKGAYIEGDNSTLALFTPGTRADYTIKIINNGDSVLRGFIAYLPIPKTGENFGTIFQDEAFKWDLSLIQALEDIQGFEVTYAANVDSTNYTDASKYSSADQGFSQGYTEDDVNMIRVTTTQDFAPGAEIEIIVPLKVNETFDSAIAGSKIGTLNVYNPSYDVVSSTFTGTLKGTRVGTELVIAEIGGTVFLDSDANGLYNETAGDTPIAGHEVELYVLDEISGNYVAVTNALGDIMTTTTDTNGVYLFDYTNDLGYSTYAIRFMEKKDKVYQYTINNHAIGKENVNSDAIITNDIPNAGDTYRGWVLGIDATTAEAKTIGAGFLEYNPPIELVVELEEKLEVELDEVRTIKPVLIGPDFWESVKHKTDTYTWELVNPTDTTYVTLSNTTKEVATLAARAETPVGYMVEVRLTIKDVYGNTATDTMLVTVVSNEPPVVSTKADAVLIHELGESYTTNLKELVDVTDKEDTVIDLNSLVVTGTVDVNTKGDNEISYVYTDTDGNESVVHSLIITVVDTTAPLIENVTTDLTFELGAVVDEASINKALGNYTISDADGYTSNLEGIDSVDSGKLNIVQEVKLAAVDPSGNRSEVVIRITVVDTTAPLIENANTNLIFEVGSLIDEASINTALGNYTISDADGYTSSFEGIDSIDSGKLDLAQEVKFVAVDPSGNRSDVVIRITIVDTQKPDTTLESSVTYLTTDVVSEEQFLLDIHFSATDNFTPKDKLVISTTFDTVDFSEVGSKTVVKISVKDSSDNENVSYVTVEILRAIEYHIEGEGFEITMEEYLEMIETGNIEQEVVERSGAKAWADHPVTGIEELDVVLKNKDTLPIDVRYGEIVDGELGIDLPELSTITRRLPYFGTMSVTEQTRVELIIPIKIFNPEYIVNFYDCDGEIVKQDWINHGEDATGQPGLAYPTVSFTNITKDTDAYPVNCSSGFVIPNTGSK